MARRMTPEQFQRLETLFHQAIDLDEEGRERFLQDYSSDPEAERALRSMLASVVSNK